MHHDLTPEIRAQLEQRHMADLKRIDQIFECARRERQEFDRHPPTPQERFGFAFAAAVFLLALLAYTIGSL